MYRKIITMTAFNRPKYLEAVLDALKVCDCIEGYTILARVEPGNQEVIDLLNSIDFCEKVVTVNSQVLGNCMNTLAALDDGFDKSDFVVHVEDDIVLAKDALGLFEACRTRYEQNPHVFSITAYNADVNSQEEKKLSVRQWFHPWGWATWINRHEAIRKQWDKKSWDTHVNLRLRNGRYEIFPMVSRAQNIGVEGGIHANWYPNTWYWQHHHVENFNQEISASGWEFDY